MAGGGEKHFEVCQQAKEIILMWFFLKALLSRDVSALGSRNNQYFDILKLLLVTQMILVYYCKI